MKKIYLDSRNKSKIMSPIGMTESEQFKCYSVKLEQHYEEYIEAVEFNRVLGAMTKALEVSDIDDLKDFLKLSLKELNK